MQKEASEIAHKICRRRNGFGYAELQTLGLRLVDAGKTPTYKPLQAVTFYFTVSYRTLPHVTARYRTLPQFTAIYRNLPPPGNSVGHGCLRGFADVK